MMNTFFKIFLFSLLSLPTLSLANDRSDEYRALTLKVLKSAEFKVFLPGDLELPFSYNFEFGEAFTEKPKIVEFPSSIDPRKISYTFIDRFKVRENSTLQTGKNSLAISCIYVRGQDRRKNPSNNLPIFFLNVWIVPNDSECKGPYNGNRLDEEVWNTYIHYKVFNFESFAPEMVEFKYRNNKLQAEFLKP
jgi:hypothetical protein